MHHQTESVRDDALHAGRGLLMGAADIIPGVSGGTVALILGIYNRLVTAISHVDGTFAGHVRHGRWLAAARHIDLRFLMALGLGIATGIVSLGSLMHWLLEHQRQHTLAAFFGLIAASSLLVGRMIHRWNATVIVLLLGGTAAAVWIVRQPALAHPPDTLWYVFLCGVLGICAMILPGISGAFILLILGKYHDLTGIIKETLRLQITQENAATVAVFASGCAIGLICFSKFLRWLLGRHESETMAVLCGFMLGSLWKIWPFQRDLRPEVTEFKLKSFELLPPGEIAIDGAFWTTLAVMAGAGGAVLLLDRLAAGRQIEASLPTAN